MLLGNNVFDRATIFQGILVELWFLARDSVGIAPRPAVNVSTSDDDNECRLQQSHEDCVQVCILRCDVL